MKKFAKITLIVMSTLLFGVGCANQTDTPDEDEEAPVEIVTSIYPVYEIVNEIAGDQAEVSLMVGENEDAHHYEPSAQAVAAVNEADVFIYSSDIMEFWAEDLLSVNENDDLQIIEMAENFDLALEADDDLENNHHAEEHDHEHSHDEEGDEGQTVTIDGVADHYHTGDEIELTASHDSNYDHWHWFAREDDSEEWAIIEEQFSDTLTETATVNGLEIKAELYDDNHNVIAESEPITIVIDDHERDHDHINEEEQDNDEGHDDGETITIDGLAGHYHTGDMIELTASHESDYDHWHWFSRNDETEEWSVVEDQNTNVLTGSATIDGQEIKAELYDENHNVIAESEPVSIVIDDHEGDNGHASETLDPHFWLDPVAVNEILPVIVEGLSEIDPEGAEIYQDNATAFSTALEDLDAAYQEAFEGAENRSFVVQHQAFGHLAQRYDLEQVSVSGMITEVEPNPQALVDITEFVNENDIPIIYYQDGENSSTAESIAAETDTEVATLYDLENSISEDGFEENVYIEAMYHNLEQLQKSIQ